MPKGAFTWEKAVEFWEAAAGFFAEAEAGAFHEHPIEGAHMAKRTSEACKGMCELASSVAALEGDIDTGS